MGGETTQFSAYYAQYAPRVRRYLLALAGDATLADDLTAETFARAWTAFDRIREPTMLAYLLAIARNLHRNSVARKRPLDQLDERIPDPASTPEERAEARSELGAVLGAIRGLSEAERTPLLLRADHTSYEEIARVLGISVNAAKVRVHRARVRLMKSTGRESKD
ncbi:MAG TPA: sigma-70 family RNA polymerase sigma factor [Parvularculaceae bacterium]|nr:sigma-70 family RNA polymerase sigma factor [Parvularculaceae bacterium]